MLEFLKDGISLDEFKVSSLIILLNLSIIFTFYIYATNGDITENWLKFLSTMVYTVGGINIVGGMQTVVGKVLSNKIDEKEKL